MTFSIALACRAATGCGADRDPTATRDLETAGAEPESTPAAATDTLAAEPEAPLPGSSPDCPADMALVEGAYCPAVQQVCTARQEAFGEGGKVVQNQCKAYAAPTVCLVPRRTPMRYCMDRYEWPNERGALPRVLTSWQDARKLCDSRGKRLCSEAEFNFACEGEEMLPYVYGYERDATKCNLDRIYRPRTFVFTPFDTCMGDEKCRAAFDAIDQRMPSGSLEACQSKQGIFDLNGNVNEWVIVPDKKSPHRSGLKGGWWGPVRNRCRPTVGFHDEGDYGYEAGFRCCSDTAAPGP